MKIQGEQIFGVPTTSFAVGPSNEDYVLNYSADGVNFSPWSEETPAGETLVVSGFAKGMGFYLEGNASTVYIQY